MNIIFNQTGKKYYREWIFRNVNLNITAGQRLAILGPNGSGKSTLLQVAAGAVIPTEGKVSYSIGSRMVSSDEIFNHVSLATPLLELIEEFTLTEIIDFHFKFKEPVSGLSKSEILELTGLAEQSAKVFRYFSSGMKQRVKLALACLSNSEILILDEPCTNLDSNGIAWYHNLIGSYGGERTILVASNNIEEEHSFCTTVINMSDLK